MPKSELTPAKLERWEMSCHGCHVCIVGPGRDEDDEGRYVEWTPELAAALELQEAVAWIEENGSISFRRGVDVEWRPGPWMAFNGSRAEVACADTLPEAVRALRVKMGEL